MSEFRFASIESLIHPTPRNRIENPIPTTINRGDLVRAKIGPATGKLGFVVVERNGNYSDYELYCNQESIGVGFSEDNSIDSDLKKVLGNLIPKKISVVRWFDSPDQLEVVASVKQETACGAG